MLIETGLTAPDFTLASTRGQGIRLGQYLDRRHVLLMFYPTGHPGCCGDKVTSAAVTGQLDRFHALDIEPVAISADGSMGPSIFMSSLDLPFPVLVDDGNAVHLAYGAMRSDRMIPLRANILIGKNGRVIAAEAGRPTMDQLFALLESSVSAGTSAPITSASAD